MTTVDDRRSRLADLLRSGCGERPLSHGEEALLLSETIGENSAAATVVFTGRLEAWPDPEALDRALRALVHRHDILRTTYHLRDGGMFALVMPSSPIHLRRIQSSSVTTAQELADLELRTPFDLASGPLLRASLVSSGGDGVMILALHHIVTDLWSATVLLEEFGQLYDRELGVPGASGVPPAPPRYREFVRRQQESTTNGAVKRSSDYWSAQLAGPLPVLELPTDRPRSTRRAARRRGFSVTTSASARKAVEQLAQGLQTTPAAVLLTAFQVTLHRWTNQQDLLVGVPFHGRDAIEFARTAGLFVNELPIRSRLDAKTTYRQLLHETDHRLRDARANAGASLLHLTKHRESPRDATRAPLFQVDFAFQSIPRVDRGSSLRFVGAAAPEDELPTDHFGVRQSIGDLDLSVMVAPVQSGYALRVDYAADLFETTTIKSLTTTWLTVLEHVTYEPGAVIQDIPLLTGAARRSRLTTLSGERVDFQLPDTLTGCLDRSVDRDPQATALLSDDGRTMSYGVLADRSRRVTARLIESGVRPGDRVGICVPRSFEAIVAIYGVLRAGAAYVPLDPTYAPERLRYMVEDAGVTVTVVVSATAAFATWSDVVLLLDVDSMTTDPFTDYSLDGQNDAYIIYTSGSTGRPKGVAVQHSSVINHNASYVRRIELTAVDRVLQFYSLSFDGSVEEIFPTLLTGGTLVIPADPGLLSPRELERLINSTAISVVDLPTAYWHQWAESMSPNLRADCPSLRLVTVGGEAASSAKLRRWQQRGGPRWINTYGPTEATVVCATHEPGDPGASVVPIGRPLPNTDAFVLDDRLEPVPQGMVGELCVGGVGVARGYHRRPDLTADRFVENPYGPGRLYRTGDLVRESSSGDLEYLGRRDRQVKIRGFRVEPGEIEAALMRCTGVTEATVVVTSGDEMGPRLIAYVTGDADTGRVRAELSAWLPPYLVPHRIIRLDVMPMTGSGKIDRSALPDLPEQLLPAVGPSTTTTDPLERQLLAVWSEVLGLATLTVDDNFFAVGGDSIQAMRVVARCAADGLFLTARQLFEHQTVAELAGLLAGGDSTGTSVPPAQGEQPLLPMQRWFFEQDFVEPHHWVQSVLLRASGVLVAATVRSALSRLAAEHDAFRLSFAQDAAGRWAGRYQTSPSPVDLRVIDLPGGDHSDAIEAASTHAHQAHRLSEPPLFRAVLFRAAGEPDRLLLSGHHLVVDGVSWRVLLDDLERAYRACLRGSPAGIRGRAPSMQMYARALARPQLPDHWDGMDQPPAVLAVDDHRELDLEGTSRTLDIELTPATTATLLERGVVQEALVVAVAIGLRGWTDRPTVRVFVEGHGRDIGPAADDFSRTIGWFTSMFPLDVPTTLPFDETRAAVRRQLAAVHDGGVGWLAGHPRSDSGAGICINYLGVVDEQRVGEFQIEGLQIGVTRGARNRRAALLEIDAAVIAGRLVLSVGYSTARHSSQRIERLATELRSLLEDATHDDAPQEFALTPLQRGVLFDSLASQQPHPYVGQLVCRFTAIGADVIRTAVRAVTARHPALRTSFRWSGRSEPVQRVLWAVEPEWRTRQVEDLDCIDDVAAEDLAEPLDWAGPPHRWTLVSHDEHSHHLIWTHHHIQLDGWSLAIVVADLLVCVLAVSQRHELPAARPTSVAPLVRWLAEQDQAPTSDFWRSTLAGSSATTLTAGVDRSRTGTGERRWEVSADLVSTVQHFARTARTTVSTVYLSAWALVLARRTGARDLLFGTVSSGRSAPIADIEAMVGLLANSLPARVRVRDEETVAAWMTRQHLEEAARREHEYLPMSDLRRASGVSPGQDLFESLLVVENYPVTDAVTAGATMGVTDIDLRESLDLPLTIEISVGEVTRIVLTYRNDHFEQERAEQIGSDFLEAVVALSDAKPDTTVGDLYSVSGVSPRSSQRPRGTDLPAATVAPFTGHDHPRGEIECSLAALWREMLDVPTIRRSDDFIALGGDSIRAIRMVELCRERFGVSVPLREVIQRPTLAEVARAIRAIGAAEAQEWVSPMLTLRPGVADHPAVFLVHPVSGQATVFAALARLIPGQGPVFAFENRPHPDSTDDVMALAKKYAACIQATTAASSTNRYILAGYSFGALVGLEAAALLQASGRSPARLVLIDPPTVWGQALPDATANQLAVELAGLEGWDDGDLTTVASVHEAARRAGRPLGHLPFSDVERLAAAAAAHYDMLRRYEPTRYPGGADLLLVHDHPYHLSGVEALLGDSEARVATVSGTHSTLLEQPHVQRTAQLLGRALSQPVENSSET